MSQRRKNENNWNNGEVSKIGQTDCTDRSFKPTMLTNHTDNGSRGFQVFKRGVQNRKFCEKKPKIRRFKICENI